MECVGMGTQNLFRVPFGCLMVVMTVLCAPGLSSGEEHIKDPTIEDRIILEAISGPDENPAVLRATIPWNTGEPVITGFSYRTGLSNWTRIEDWEMQYSTELNCSFITFQLKMDWGVLEEVMVRVTDLLGGNATAGAKIICSRRPEVDIKHVKSDGERPVEGRNRFIAEAIDPDGQGLSYKWTVDDLAASSDSQIDVYLPAGEHSIGVEVTDGQWLVREWMNVSLNGMDRIEVEKGPDVMKWLSLIFMTICLIAVITFIIYAFSTVILERSRGYNIGVDQKVDEKDPFGQICEICMKEVRSEQLSITCRCGARVHRGCGRREGVCPKCGREILI